MVEAEAAVRLFLSLRRLGVPCRVERLLVAAKPGERDHPGPRGQRVGRMPRRYLVRLARGLRLAKAQQRQDL